MKTNVFGRRLLAAAALLAILGSPTLGRMAFAQEGTTEPVPQTQPVETNENNEFPWGLLGLLGLGGLAGLRRREEPRRVETIDASRRAGN